MSKKKTISKEPVEAYTANQDAELIDSTTISWHLEIVKERLANLEAEMEGAVSLEEMRRRVATRLV
jgi:hypothetical protein